MIIMGLDNFHKLDKEEPMLRDIKNGTLGNVIIYAKHIDKKKPIKSLLKINQYIQEIAPIPVFIAIDEEGGKVNRLKPKYGFAETRSAQYLGQLQNEDSTRYFARSSAIAMKSVGINMNFAPDVDVDVAGDGIRATQLASQMKYDVVVCDIRLPGQDGFAVLGELNRLNTRPKTILITAYPESKVYQQMQEVGADEIMVKRLDLSELAHRILALSGRENGKHA